MDIYLPKKLGYGRLDTLIRVLSLIRSETPGPLRLNWSKTEEIAPAGLAMLACVFDSAVEHRVQIKNVFIKSKFRRLSVVKNLQAVREYARLPKPSVHNFSSERSMLTGNETAIDPTFVSGMIERFSPVLTDELSFSCQLIINELMQNSIDHSTAERYYLYAGLWPAHRPCEIHVGVLDMGVTTPAKLEQRYACLDDGAFLALAFQEGTSTRRQRPGGLGLFLTFEHLKASRGTLTVLSRDAELIRYFKSKRVVRQKLKDRLQGTWCLARLSL